MASGSISTIIITVLTSVLASSGMWSVILYVLQKKHDKRKDLTAESRMLRALAHDRLYYLGNKILRDYASGRRKYISADDYDNYRVLYEGYRDLHGNGTCEKLWNEINKLPIGQHE